MLKKACLLFLKACGWKIKSDVPDNLRSFIMIGAPHTSNVDFIPAMAIGQFLHRNTRYIIKDDWLKFPLNLIFAPTGAIGINRKKLKEEGKASTTDQMADLFKKYPDLVLMISPEGTRSPNPNWKTGFYYIAQKANVPIVLAYADYKKKELATGPIIYPENFEQDMAKIMKFYDGIQGKKPQHFVLDSRY